MIETVKAHLVDVESFSTTTAEGIEEFRIKYAGKKGILNELFAAFRTVNNEEKKAYGQALNGKGIGEVVEVNTPMGVKQFTIKKLITIHGDEFTC